MSKSVKSILLWLPRILGILFTLFVGLFSLDVFEMGGGFWNILGGFLIHNIPTLILVAALVIGWRREWAGAVGFLGFGAWYLVTVRGFNAGTYIMLAGIPLLVGALFLAGWLLRRQVRGN
jgi:hypothetical protein